MRIAILTRLPSYYSEQRLSEEGKKRGHDIKIVQYPKCYINLDPLAPDVRYEGKPLDGVDAIIPRLAIGSVSYGAAITRQLEVSGVYTTVGSIAITRTFDRARSLQVLSKAGIPIPKTIVARETEQWDDLLAHFELPVVIESVSLTKGGGPVIVETPKAATTITRAIGNGTPFIVQERMGDDSVDIAAMVIGSRVAASVKHAIGKTKASAIPVKLTIEENKTILRASKALGLAICTIQIIRSAQGTYVIGADATPGLEMFETATKRNIAEKVIEYIELNAKRRNKKDRVGA